VCELTFNGDTNDSSGNANDYSAIGGVTYTQDRWNRANQAVSFDGSSGYLDRGDFAGNVQRFSQGFSISVWVNPAGFALYGTIIDFGSGSASGNIILYEDSDPTQTIGAKVLVQPNHEHWIKGIQNWTTETGTWIHFAYTVDASGNAVIYKNNAVLASGFLYPPQDIARQHLFIGKSNYGSYFFSGSMDDIRIYNRAITAAEVSALFNAGS
jgi:hypothetical protein